MPNILLWAGLAPAQLTAAPAPGEWSADEVLAHLRACADVWGGCIEAILAQDKPAIRAGKPLERSMLFYAQWMVTHERPHLKQIERIINAVRLQQP